MRRHIACVCVAVLLGGSLVAPAHAAALRYTLEPRTVRLGVRAYGLGLLPIDGRFTRFHGTLVLDDADPAACTLAVEAESASLQMPAEAMTADALGPDLLDAARFPAFRIDGHCRDGQLVGTLLLHGTTGPVALEVRREAGAWSASGLIRRADWGMGARPLTAGPEVRVSMTAGLPGRGP